jgi:hypothetical protein
MAIKKFKNFIGLITMAIAYENTNKTAFPDMTTRVARKEMLVQQMSDYIKQNVPLNLVHFAYLTGLKAGFARAIGEAGDSDLIQLMALVAVPAGASPTQYNLKWQVVGAYRNLSIRFPNDPDIK